MNNKSYDETSIKVLRGLDAVKKRPGMYIGNTEDGTGLHHMVFEVLDNSLDEYMAGFCNKIEVVLGEDNNVTITDNGRGIPIAPHPEEKVSTAEVVLTTLHAGGKFDSDSYQISGGMHGVGLSCVNALSQQLELEIWRDGLHYRQLYKNSYPESAIIKTLSDNVKTGTRIAFVPSRNYFNPATLDPDIIKKRLQELAYLNPQLSLTFTYKSKTDVFKEKLGLVSLVRKIGSSPEQTIIELHGRDQKDNSNLEFVLQWSKSYKESFFCYTNNIAQPDGGTHLVGLKLGIYRAIKEYTTRVEEFKKWSDVLNPDDTREGLVGIISIFIPDPKFSSQTKDKLINSKTRHFVEKIIKDRLLVFLLENKDKARALIEYMILVHKGRQAAQHAKMVARQVNKNVCIANLPGKLAPCQTKNPEEAELFLVEGDSAGGSAKQARQRYNQAILPLRGKILNVQKSHLEAIQSSDQIINILSALHITNLLHLNLEKVSYHKIIIMADGDVDGRHVRCLLLTLFFRYLRSILEQGWLYIAQPPLYSISYGKGKKEQYILDDKALEQKLLSLGSDNMTIYEQGGKKLDLQATMTEYNNYMSTRHKVESLLPDYMVDLLMQGQITQQKRRFLIEGAKITDKETGTVYVLHADLKQIRTDLKLHKARHLLQDKIRVVRNNMTTHVSGIAALRELIMNQGRDTVQIKRYKGLGEMNPDQLAETTMNATTRHLMRVSVEDAALASTTFDCLMGKDVEPRRDFIVKNSYNFSLDNLD